MKKYIKCHVKQSTNKEKIIRIASWDDIPEFKNRRWISGNEFWSFISEHLGIPYTSTFEGSIRGFDLMLPPFSKGS